MEKHKTQKALDIWEVPDKTMGAIFFFVINFPFFLKIKTSFFNRKRANIEKIKSSG